MTSHITNSSIIDKDDLSQTKTKSWTKTVMFNFQQTSYNTKKLIIEMHSPVTHDTK